VIRKPARLAALMLGLAAAASYAQGLRTQALHWMVSKIDPAPRWAFGATTGRGTPGLPEEGAPVNPDHPLSGASATIYPIDGEALARLRKKRHLQRLLAVCEGDRDPADVGLDRPLTGHEVGVHWEELREWLRARHRPGDRWDPSLLDRYLRKIARKAGPAAYWTGKRELARDRVYTLEGVSAAGSALREAGLGEGVGERMVILLSYLAQFVADPSRPQSGFVLLRKECAPSPSSFSPLGPVRDPGRLDTDDPDNVVAYLRYRAVNQIHNTFREYHAADEVLEFLRAGDDVVRAAIDAACTTMIRHGQEPETVDMAYHLTSSSSPPEFFAALLDRLEADDLPPIGPPLHKDLRREFLHRLDGPTVATDPALRPRAEALLEAAGLRYELLGLALRGEGSGADLARRMREADPGDLSNWTARCVAERVAADPNGNLDAVEALGRAKPEVHAFFWRVLEEQAPAWLPERRAEVAALLPVP
jgi:hypothetical protein